jgi:hypothetical protein
MEIESVLDGGNPASKTSNSVAKYPGMVPSKNKIIEDGKKFLPSVDFNKFNKYSYLFDESNYLPDDYWSNKLEKKQSPMKKDYNQ